MTRTGPPVEVGLAAVQNTVVVGALAAEGVGPVEVGVESEEGLVVLHNQ